MEVPPWRTIYCPASVRFARVYKELFCCRSRFYLLYHPDCRDIIWLCQSMNGLAIEVSRSQRYGAVHVSCAYRYLRGQCARKRYRGLQVVRLKTIEEVNEEIESVGAGSIAVVVRDPENWIVADDDDGETSEIVATLLEKLPPIFYEFPSE